MVRLLAERCDAKSNVKLGRFWSQLQASYVSNHTEELWYNETVCLWMTIFIFFFENYIVSSNHSNLRVIITSMQILYNHVFLSGSNNLDFCFYVFFFNSS